jgi:hypothetical protein
MSQAFVMETADAGEIFQRSNKCLSVRRSGFFFCSTLLRQIMEIVFFKQIIIAEKC